MQARTSCSAVAIWVALAFGSARASADELPDASVVGVSGSGVCLDNVTFRARIAERTGALRTPESGEAAPKVAATIERCQPFEQDVWVGRFCGHDASGHEWTRTVIEADCEAAREALAEIAADFIVHTPEFIPPPEAASYRAPPKASARSIAFGMTALAVYDTSTDRANGGARVFGAGYSGKRGAPRVGGAAAVSFYDGEIMTARAGGLLAWGGPWNETVPGVIVEGGAITRHASSGAEPYLAVSLMIQMVTHGAMRPVLGFTTTVLPLSGRSGQADLQHAAELGFAWQL